MTTKTNDGIVVSSELEALITPLTNEEFKELENSILLEGCRDPLIVWENMGVKTLVDGHHRYKICTKKGIPFDSKIKTFQSKDHVKEWMISNQLGRRNLNPTQISYYRGLKYLSLKKKKGGYDSVLSKGNINETTAENLASEFKSSPSTIKRDAQFAIGLSRIGESNPDLKIDILTGNVNTKKSDVIMLSVTDKDFTVSNETDVKDLANHIRRSQLKEVEQGLEELNKKKVESAQEILREKEPMFLNRDDQINTIKGKIISAINEAIRTKNTDVISKIKDLIDKLGMAIFQE